MFLLLLSRRGLVAVEAIHVLAGVHTQLVLVNHRIGLVVVALGALAGGAHQRGARLLSFHLGALAVNEECRHDKRESEDNRNEYGAEGHGGTLEGFYLPSMTLRVKSRVSRNGSVNLGVRESFTRHPKVRASCHPCVF